MLVHRLAHKAYSAVKSVTSPITVGVRMLMINDGKVVLVKHTYDTKWCLPGGGVKRGETLEAAAKREAREETGAVIGDVSLFGVYTNFYEKRSDHVVVFLTGSFELKGAKSYEIESSGLFDIGDKAVKLTRGTENRLEEYLQGKNPYYGMW